jgi:hypothetical protein
MIGKIATITKTAQKTNANQKDINCSTVQMKWLHVLLNLSIQNVRKTFQHLQKCKNTWQNKQRVKQRNLPMKVVTTNKKMTNRCFDK